MRTTLIYLSLGFLWLSVIAEVFPLANMDSKQRMDNPKNCPYYITVASIMANSKLLAVDKANNRLIKSRLLRFENDVAAKSTSPITAAYKDQYYATLNKFHLTSIKTVADESLILLVASNVSKTVDDYYLDENTQCHPRLYTWNTWHTVVRNPITNSRRILQYNLGNLYDNLPSRYLRITGASQDEFQLGVFSGFFVNNQTTSLNIQLMTGVPMLTAIYILPKNNFANMGTYLAVVPWNSIYGLYFQDPSARKIYNIAGIDVFTLETSDPYLKTIPNAIPVPASVNKNFVIANELHTFINTESYGMAYLANHITYENPKVIRKLEKSIKRNFASGGQYQDSFVGALDQLYSKLDSLKDKYDIILETKRAYQIPAAEMTEIAGSVDIKGIVGERANFTTDCLRQNCTFVFNTAKAPGWHAYVNGKAARLDRANFAFMAVPVPNGHAIVWFIYQSWACLLSYLVSMFTLIFVLFSTMRLSKISTNTSFTPTGS